MYYYHNILTANVNIKNEARTEGFSSADPDEMDAHSCSADIRSKSGLLRLRNSSTVLVLMRVPTAAYDLDEISVLLQRGSPH